MVPPTKRISRYAARYRAARAYAGLSQEELAEKLGVDAQTIKRRESGRQEPKTAERIAVATICKVPLEFMENGWGGLQPDEIRELLATQSGILDEIKGLLSGDTGSLLPAIRGILEGRPPGARSTPPEVPQQPEAAET